MRIHLWTEQTRGTTRPVVEGNRAWWWGHAIPGCIEDVGDLVEVHPEGQRWRVTDIEYPPDEQTALFGLTLRRVRAELVAEQKWVPSSPPRTRTSIS